MKPPRCFITNGVLSRRGWFNGHKPFNNHPYTKQKPHKPLGCGVSWLLLLDLNQWHQTLSHALLRVVHSTQKSSLYLDSYIIPHNPQQFNPILPQTPDSFPVGHSPYLTYLPYPLPTKLLIDPIHLHPYLIPSSDFHAVNQL